MNLKNFKITNKGLYWGLIITFMLLYACVGFVSTLHSITFFQLANSMGLAILLGLTYEVGQASVLFSILMSEKNQGKFLPWALMILLTALQVTANVYASFKFMLGSGSNDWTYWQKSILFGVQASSPEMYQVIISWISGALLPIIALGMTALVAQNMNFMKEEDEGPPLDAIPKLPISDQPSSEPLQIPLKQQFEKDFIVDKKETKDKKPAGRKKAQEPLQKESVKVPEKKHRISNPLSKKAKKPELIKHIEQINPTSKGEELIESLKHEVKSSEDNAPIKQPVVVETPPEYPKVYDPIEVVDVKAVPVVKKK